MNNVIEPRGHDFNVVPEKMDDENLFDLDDDTPLPTCSQNPDEPCEACQ